MVGQLVKGVRAVLIYEKSHCVGRTALLPEQKRIRSVSMSIIRRVKLFLYA